LFNIAACLKFKRRHRYQKQNGAGAEKRM